MDKELTRYIINYFSNLMHEDEKLALRHQIYFQKSEETASLRKIMTEKGLISTDPQILALLKDGYEQFEESVAKRILNDSADKIYLNNCPRCSRLARTPQARQCRHCGYDWHENKQGIS